MSNPVDVLSTFGQATSNQSVLIQGSFVPTRTPRRHRCRLHPSRRATIFLFPFLDNRKKKKKQERKRENHLARGVIREALDEKSNRAQLTVYSRLAENKIRADETTAPGIRVRHRSWVHCARLIGYGPRVYRASTISFLAILFPLCRFVSGVSISSSFSRFRSRRGCIPARVPALLCTRS